MSPFSQRRAIPRPKLLSPVTKDALAGAALVIFFVAIVVLQVEFPRGVFH